MQNSTLEQHIEKIIEQKNKLIPGSYTYDIKEYFISGFGENPITFNGVRYYKDGIAQPNIYVYNLEPEEYGDVYVEYIYNQDIFESEIDLLKDEIKRLEIMQRQIYKKLVTKCKRLAELKDDPQNIKEDLELMYAIK